MLSYYFCILIAEYVRRNEETKEATDGGEGGAWRGRYCRDTTIWWYFFSIIKDVWCLHAIHWQVMILLTINGDSIVYMFIFGENVDCFMYYYSPTLFQ